MPKATDLVLKLECELSNKHGIHVRTAALISELCERYDTEVILKTARGESDGRDMMRLLMLEAGCGTTLSIEATGPQATEALTELSKLIASGFDDEDMN